MVSNKKLKIFILLFSLVSAMFSYYVWQVFKTPNFRVEANQPFELFIPEKASYETVLDTLKKHDLVRDQLSFRFLAKVLNYPEKIRPGRYIIHSEMGNWEMLRKLRNGRQDAYKVVINNFRLKEDMAGRIANQTAYDSAAIYAILDSTELMQQWGFNSETSPAIFVPNTYEVNWTTSFSEFLTKMNRAYEKFWTTKRKSEAEKLGLTPVQVSILASIVYGESKNSKEQARVAGVYWNRLQINMPLQADPTVVFAWKDFTIKRVTSKYTALNSPYNTYRNTGLPPGPISIVPSDVIDRVLNLEHHQFLYFCAKEDFSENHSFAVTYKEHMQNAANYQNALDQRKIQ
ncbi:MAG: endolytic transglycosylase MltG [Cytophagales bacterium]|nr:endolytic transglycosylase MltG [Cytophagales bacterium]